jgi:hypothetical protein
MALNITFVGKIASAVKCVSLVCVSNMEGSAMDEGIQYRDPPGVTAPATPLHLWIVGVVSLLWNSFGCYDYTMTRLDPAGYLSASGFGVESVTYLQSLPAWITAFWALGVWGSLAGSFLLLLRSRHAATAFAASLLGLAVSQFSQWTGPLPAEMNTSATWGITATIWIVLIALLLYARAQVRAWVLR